MRSRLDLAVAPAAMSSADVSPSAGDTRMGFPGADAPVGSRCEVLLRSDLDPRRTVVSVVGLLGHSGGALLAAVLEYVRERGGGPVAVDLRGVSHADRRGLAPVIASGAVLAGTSPAVDQVLDRCTRTVTDSARRARGGETGPPPTSGTPLPGRKRPSHRGPRLDLVRVHDV
jgi:hypothetical protein